ncbi:hypothetical protein [Ornithinimicrobium kibberense]|uniref:hypothetical protein n=1 Tax=Ornithinimicrobium kibberense TaxID=282060 RepID=UPI0036132651
MATAGGSATANWSPPGVARRARCVRRLWSAGSVRSWARWRCRSSVGWSTGCSPRRGRGRTGRGGRRARSAPRPSPPPRTGPGMPPPSPPRATPATPPRR